MAIYTSPFELLLVTFIAVIFADLFWGYFGGGDE